MQIRVLGCAGSIAAGCRTTSFLLGGDILVDAGTGVGDLTIEEMARIDHILISHSHLDHVLAIGLLADSVTRLRKAGRRPPVTVHALPQTLAALREHIFNGVIWPDFTRLPSAEHPVLALSPVEVGQVLLLGQRRIEVLPAAHTVPAVGYAAFGAQGAAWVFTGDTGPNPALWQRLAALDVKLRVIETAFRDEEHALATVSQHLCPQMLAQELAQFTQPTEVYITHIKPGELDTVMSQIGAQNGPHRIHALVSGQVLMLDERTAD
jgi:ribonuclease BN (tRNA processing enzyme)